MIRALRAESLRVRTDVVLAVHLLLALLLPVALARADEPEVSGSLVVAVLTSVLSSSYAAFRLTFDASRGVLRSDLVRLSSRHVIGARLARAMIAGVLLGALLSLASLALFREREMWHDALLAGAAAGAICAPWGFGLALLIRAHLLTMFVVPTTISLMIMLQGWIAPSSPWTLVGSIVALIELGPLSLWAAGAWIGAVLLAGLLAFSVRQK